MFAEKWVDLVHCYHTDIHTVTHTLIRFGLAVGVWDKAVECWNTWNHFLHTDLAVRSVGPVTGVTERLLVRIPEPTT